MQNSVLRKNQKGQTTIFESVVLFAVSVIIFIVLISIFGIYQNFYLSSNIIDQLEEVNTFLTSNILFLAEKDADSIVTVEIPKTIGTYDYEIRVVRAVDGADNDGLNISVLATGQSSFTTLFNLTERYNVSGERILSRRGRVIINKQRNRIILS